MSSHHQVFLRSARSVDAISTDIAHAIGIDRLDPIEPLNTFESFRGSTGSTVVELEIGHSYEVDRDMHFEDFPILVTVRDLGRNVESERSVAQNIGESLAETGDYDALVVFDLQRRLWMNR